MTARCPHPQRDCYLCETDALDYGSLDVEVLVSDEDCSCGCAMVVFGDGVTKCLGCGVAS